MNRIPTSRLAFYVVILATLPLLLVSYFYLKQQHEWENVSERIMAVHNSSEMKVRKQALNTAVRKKFAYSDDFYIDNQLETLTFLKKEREALEVILNNPTFTGNEAAERRYAFLSGEANCLRFTQGSVQSGDGGIQECAEQLAHPVELDAHDLKELLARIEGEKPGKPQLLITDFWLKRKALTSGSEVFEVNVKLLKREFTQ